MRNIYFLLCILTILFFSQTNAKAQGSCDDGSYQWTDVATIFENNGCNIATCHGGSASGLDLTTFDGFNMGGINCETEISSGTTLVDIIQTGNIICGDDTVENAMNDNIMNPLSAEDIATIQAYIDGGSFEFCPGAALDDGVCDPESTIDSLADPGQTTLCSDGSEPVTFDLPTASLPDVQIVIEINGVLTTISDDGSFDTSTLIAGDEVCYTAFTFDLVAINDLLTLASQLCPILDCDETFDIMGVNQAVADLVAGVNDGVPGLNDLQEALDFAGSFGNPIGSVQTAGSTLDALNTEIGDVLGSVCYASAEAICLTVIDCGPDCPMVISAEQQPSVCQDEGTISFCVTFDIAVDANTVLTVEGIVMDGSAGGTEICIDVPFTPPFDPCGGAAIGFIATAVCDGTDLLDGLVWLDTQILPATDPGCGGIAGCTDDTACNYNPDAVCDDPNDPCFPIPTCNTDPCLGDIEIIDPNDPACTCVIVQVQVLGCTDSDATNYDSTANCDDGSCMFEMCTDPCAPNFGAAEACESYDMTCNTDCTLGDIEVWDAASCACIVDIPTVPGCTDTGATNFDSAANCDDGSCIFEMCDDPCAPNFGAQEACEPYDMTCNTDCILGDIEVWDETSCSCIVDVTTVSGCTDSGATNFDSAANCDDGSCIFEMCDDPCAPNFGAAEACEPYDMTCNTDCTAGDIEIWDAASCSCTVDIPTLLGCTDSGATNFDSAANCDDGSCIFEMCDDPCAPNFGAAESCEPYNNTCNTDCLMGDIEIWDAVSCSCVIDVPTVLGCTNDMANNYNSDANCDDSSCIFSNPGCTDSCADNFDPTADEDDGSCNPYDDTCNADCSTGPFGGIWDLATCGCINEITPVSGCTDPLVSNYNPNANCDDGSCFCEEEIAGSIMVSDEGCDVSGLEVMIMAPDGTSITVTTDANGNFTVPGGPFLCGTYSATITDANVPACFTDTGNIGPVQFEVDGEGGGDDGPFFFANPEVPTLSQWGLIILALLLMTFGALRLGFINIKNHSY